MITSYSLVKITMADMLDKFPYITPEMVLTFHLRVDDLKTLLIFRIVDDYCHDQNGN